MKKHVDIYHAELMTQELRKDGLAFGAIGLGLFIHQDE